VISLPAFTLLHLEPPELIEIAALTGFDAVELATMPPSLFPYYQLCDLPRASPAAAPPGDLPLKKCFPGAGDLPLLDIIDALPLGIPVSVEVPSGSLPSRAASEAYAREALRTTRALLSR